MKLIIGLGNPGPEYTGTRHNFGFVAVEHAAEKYGSKWKKKSKFHAQIAKAKIAGEVVLFAKPMTYYNLVGQAVRVMRDYYHISNADILVIHDEMDLPIGTLRTRIGGSDAGNNGVRNLIEHLGKDFARLRIGVGKQPRHNGSTKPDANHSDFVLSRPNADEVKLLEHQISSIEDIIEEFSSNDFVETTYVCDLESSSCNRL